MPRRAWPGIDKLKAKKGPRHQNRMWLPDQVESSRYAVRAPQQKFMIWKDCAGLVSTISVSSECARVHHDGTIPLLASGIQAWDSHRSFKQDPGITTDGVFVRGPTTEAGCVMDKKRTKRKDPEPGPTILIPCRNRWRRIELGWLLAGSVESDASFLLRRAS